MITHGFTFLVLVCIACLLLLEEQGFTLPTLPAQLPAVVQLTIDPRAAVVENIALPTGTNSNMEMQGMLVIPGTVAAVPAGSLKQTQPQQISLLPSPETPHDPAPALSKTKLSYALPAALVGAGLLLIPFDRSIAPKLQGGDDVNGDFATNLANTAGEKYLLLPALGGLYVLGDSYDKKSARLALQALVESQLVTEGVKRLTGRMRPNSGEDAGNFAGPGHAGGAYMSFPSGHTSAVFALATVMAKRYPKHKWLYYAVATATGLARIRKSAHFPSDVLVGAGVGVLTGNASVEGRPLLQFKF